MEKYCLILLCFGGKHEIGCWTENDGVRSPTLYNNMDDVERELKELEADYPDDYEMGIISENNGIYTVNNLDGVREFDYNLENDKYNWV